MSNIDRFATLQSLLEQRILILDGAMGTMIQKYRLKVNALNIGKVI
jgi:5-methyltetrahydrofolate--homocysteine methyltransferase